MSAIFVSHCSRDNEVSGRIKGWLEQHGHRSLFLDFDPEHGIPPGRDWERELYRRLRACRAVVAVVSEHFLASRWCFAEITQARALGKRIIPVKVDGCTPGPPLADLQIIDLAVGGDGAARRLARALEAAGVDASDPFDWDGSRSPYPGFPCFQEEDAAIFFGRDREIGRGLDTLNRARWQGGGSLVMILGASGAGKSSLLRAGLLPRLRRDRREWLVVGPIVPGRDPLRELAAALARAFPRGDWRRVHRQLLAGHGEDGEDADGNPLLALADDLRLTSSRPEARVLVVVDQFEELLDHPAGHPSARFLRLLRGAVETEDGALMALATMRSDYLGELQGHPALRGLELTGLPLGPMPVESLAEVIEKPAALAGVDVEPGLTSALLRDAEGDGRGEGALPLVAFTLRELYSRWGDEGRLTAEQYRHRLGGLRGAVARVADSALPRGGELRRVEGALRDAFLRMVRINEEGQYSRAPVAWEELPASIRPLLERFVDARLLTSREQGPSRRVEVAHEALFSAWDRLALWLRESREALLVRKEVQRAAALWQREARSDDYLWTKGRLQRAVELRDEGRLPLDTAERAFLARSKEVEEGALRRRKLLVRGAVAAVCLVALALGALALVATSSRAAALEEKRAAEIQAAKALAIQSRTAGYPLDQALLLAVEAGRRLQELGERDLFEARTSLLNLLLANPALGRILHGHDDWIWAIAVSPDGRRLATGSSDGRLLLWDLTAGRPRWNLDPCTEGRRTAAAPGDPCPERVRTVAFSPDGGHLAAGTRAGKLLVWNADSGEVALGFQTDDTVTTLAFSSDGRTLAVGDGSGAITLWDRSPGRRAGWAISRRRTLRREGSISALAFMPGTSVLVTAGDDRTVRLHDLDSGRERVLHRGEQFVYSVAASPRGTVAAGFGDGSLRVWSRDGRPLRTATVHAGEVRDLAFSPDGGVLATAGGFDRVVKVWAADDGAPVAELGPHVQGATAVAFDPRDRRRLFTGTRSGEIRVWDLGASQPRSTRTGRVRVAFGNGVAAASALDGTVRLIRLDDWRERAPIERQAGEVWALDLSPDNRYLATGSLQAGVRLWDVASARLLFERGDHGDWIWSVAFSPQGDLLASADEAGKVFLWDLPTGVPRLLLKEGSGRAGSGAVTLAFGPRGDLLAVGRRDGRVELRDPETGRTLRTWSEHRGEISGLAFSFSGDRLAAASYDGTARVWPLGDDAGPQITLRQQEVGLTAIALGPEERRVATGDTEGVLRIWDARTGEPLFALLGHRSAVMALSFEGPARLYSGATDRTLRRWDLDVVDSLDAAYRRACAIANRNLDAAEWRRFLAASRPRDTCPGAAPRP